MDASEFIDKLRKYREQHPEIEKWIEAPGVLLGGAVCYYGSKILAEIQKLSFPDEDIFIFTVLYMIVDSMLDQPDLEVRKKVQKQFMGIMLNWETSSEDPVLNLVKKEIEHLRSLGGEVPEYLNQVCLGELKTAKIQNGSNLTRQEYWDLAKWKGGATVNAIQAILQGQVTPVTETLGLLIQLIDDCLDVEEDLDAGIMTIATYDYVINGNLDSLVVEIMGEIQGLPKEFENFKTIFEWALFYLYFNKPQLVTSPLTYQLPMKLTLTLGNQLKNLLSTK